MPSTFLLLQKRAEASSNLQNNSALARLTPAEIALVAVFSALIFGVMVFCLYRFCPGLAWRQRRKADAQQTPADIKQTFLDLDDEKTLTDHYASAPEVKQTFLHVDDEKSSAEKKGLGIDMHPAMRSSDGRAKRKHGAEHSQSLDSTSSIIPLIKNSDVLPASPERSYSPRIYSPQTPPQVPGIASPEVRVSPKRNRPLPTPVQPSRRSPKQASRYDISPLQSSSTLPDRAQLPMSFLVEIDARREDQTGVRSRTVSPLQNPHTPIPDRVIPESQWSSRNVSPVSAPSTTPVITYPSATPVYLPRPFSKYNPYRPALEPAGSKNWPLENMAIPEHSAVKGPIEISPVRKHLTQSPLKPQGTTSPTPSTPTPAPSEPEKQKETSFTHPELDHMFLEDIHRLRRQQQKAREEQQKQKRKVEREKARQRELQLAAAAAAATATTSAILRPAKRLPANSHSPPPPFSKEKGIPPNYRIATATGSPEARRNGVVRTKSVVKREERPKVIVGRKSGCKLAKSEKKGSGGLLGLPPRLPSKSRKPSQSPDAYEKARRISGLHELVGSGNLGNQV